jgi:hypothetical protein
MSDPNQPATGVEITAQEMGFPHPKAVPGDLPPGGGGYTTPNFLSFSSLVQSAARAYLWTFDEALKDNPQLAVLMRNDPVLMGALRARQRMTAQLSWHLTPQDEMNLAEQEAAKVITHIINSIPRFQKLKMYLLEALWYGKYAVEIAYQWRSYRGQQLLYVRDFIPINGDKIRFKWDGTPGFLVYPNYPGPKVPTDYGFAHFVTPEERYQYIIHEHEPEDADWHQMEMAGSIHGVGIRGRIYWLWWMKQQVFGLLMNYLTRFANGLTIFYYNASDPKAKNEAIEAARTQFNRTALIYPRWNSERPDVNKVERLEVGTASQALMWNLIDQYFDPIIARYILGQTLSHDTGTTGLGSGVAKLHQQTLDEIIKYDAINLQETLQTDLVNVLYEYNVPGIPPAKFEFEVDSPNSQELMMYGQILYNWGVPLDEDQVYRISQWQRPKPGSGIVTKLGPMQPAALSGVAGVPVSGEVGSEPIPEDQAQQMQRKSTKNRTFDSQDSEMQLKLERFEDFVRRNVSKR